MSGIAPRTKVAYDPLMNPGDVPDEPVDDLFHPAQKSSLAISKEVPVDAVLKKLALSAGQQASVDDDEVPAQSMAEFLGITPDISTRAKTNKLFADDSDDEDEATKERKAKRRAAAAALAAEQAEAKAKAAEAAALAAKNAKPQEEVVVPHTRSAFRQAPVAKVQKDLFADEEDDPAAAADRALGLQGVFIPNGAAEFHTAETKHRGEEIDQKLLDVPDDGDLDQLGGLTSKTTTSAASVTSTASGASAASAAASVVDDLDDDLFSFTTAKPTTTTSTVDASSPDFDFNSYIAKQTASTAGSTSTGASLFDD